MLIELEAHYIEKEWGMKKAMIEAESISSIESVQSLKFPFH